MFNIFKGKEYRDWIKELDLIREDLEPELEIHRITSLDDIVQNMRKRIVHYSPLVELLGYFINPTKNNGRLTHLVFPTTPVIGVPLAEDNLSGIIEDTVYGPVFGIDKDKQLGLIFCPLQTFPNLKLIHERMLFVPFEKCLLGNHSLGDLLPQKMISKFFSGNKTVEFTPTDIISLVQQEGIETKSKVLIDKNKIITTKTNVLCIPLKYAGTGTITRHTKNFGFYIKAFNNNKGYVDSFPFLGKIHTHSEGQLIFYSAENKELCIKHFGEKEYLRLNSCSDIISVFSSKDSNTKDSKNYLGQEKISRESISMVMAFSENLDYWGTSTFDLYATKERFGFQRTKNLMLSAQELRKQQKAGVGNKKDILNYFEEIINLSYINQLPSSIGDK